MYFSDLRQLIQPRVGKARAKSLAVGGKKKKKKAQEYECLKEGVAMCVSVSGVFKKGGALIKPSQATFGVLCLKTR